MQTYKPIACAAVVLIGLCGCATHGPTVSTMLRFHEQANPAMPADHLETVDFPKLNLRIIVDPSPTLSEKDVKSADLRQTPGGAAILLKFDEHGTFALTEMTTRCRGQYVVVLLNSRPVAVWLVDRQLTDGQFLLEADISDEESLQIVESLNQMASEEE